MPSVCQVNNVNIDLVYSDTIEENIISINSKKELFFDVYECIINDEKLVLEKVGDSELGPKVLLQVNIEGKNYSAEAILVDNGSNYVELNKENIYFIRTIPEENFTLQESEIEEIDIDNEEQSGNAEVNYENIIEHHVNNKLVFLHELEEQFEEKIVSLKDDISDKLDLFFEKLEDKKKIIIEEKLGKITTELNEKFILLQSELHGVEDFSKKNIDNILEQKITEIDSSVNLFLEGITKEYKNKIISSDKKITHNFLELNSIKDKLKENNSTTNKKFDELNLLKEKLLEQDEVILKNEELKKFINEEFSNIDNKFKNLSEEENKKYNELLAAVSNKDVVEYKTILKEKIQDVELTQIKESLQEEISSALKGDIVSLKRYVEMSSGGGSTAKQFAAGGTMDGNLTVAGDLSARTYLGIDIPPVNGLYLPLSGGNLTGILSSNNTIVADTILATNLLSATTLDIGFELSGFNVTGSLSASGNISSGSLTNPALSTDGIDAKFTDNVIIAGDLDIGFPNENENQCITIHGSNSSGKRTQLIQTGGAFCIHPTVGNQCLILGSLSNHITMLCGNASHELRIPTGKVNIGTTGGTEKLTVAGNISASGGLSANNINVTGDILPSQTTTFNLGSSALRFKDIFLDGSTIDLSGTKIMTDSEGDIEFRDAANLPKRLKASEIVLESSDDPDNDIVFKVNSGGNPEFQKRRRSNPNIIEPSITTTDILSATQVRVDGNVGIGTGPSTPPNRRLTVVGEISATGSISTSNNLQLGGNIVDTDANEIITIGANDVNFTGKHINSGFDVGIRGQRGNCKGISSASNNSNLGIYNCSIEAITLDTTGKVGMGTTTPNELLHVEDSSSSSGTSITIQNAFGESPKNIKFRYNDNVETARIVGYGRNSTSLLPYLAFHVNQSTSSLASNDVAERMRINSTGEVGIGKTATTGVELDVNGDIAASGSLSASGSNPNYFAGKVGIGTATPVQDLELNKDNANVNLNIRSSNAGNATLLFGDQSDVSTGSVTYNNNDNSMLFKVNNQQEAMRINSTGKVGIGSSVPNEKLTVAGNISASGNIFSGGLAVCTSVPAPSTPTLQAVTTQGSTTTVSLSVAALSASGKIIGGSSFNSANGTNAAVLGGINNEANGFRSVIGGGQNNKAKGTYSFIGGGNGNCTSIHPYGAVVAGGMYNRATYYSAAVLGGTSNHASGAQSIVGGGTSNYATGTRSVAVGGRYSRGIGYESFVGGGYNNHACGNNSSIVGGSMNRTSGLCSSILGGSGNCINTGHNCSFIIGSNITSSAACTTFVNNLTSLGSLDGCSITSLEGVKVGGGSIISCNASFTPSLSDNGKTLLLDTTSGSIVVTVTPQISGFATRYIKEAGASPVVFSTGTGLSGLYSFQDRNQMSIIYAQADIFFKSDNYAFLGGNLQ